MAKVMKQDKHKMSDFQRSITEKKSASLQSITFLQLLELALYAVSLQYVQINYSFAIFLLAHGSTFFRT